ncbi:MAG: hypothetical protein ACI8X5_002957 [Planctomycetota bacterium]|jgi:hypothetical protein
MRLTPKAAVMYSGGIVKRRLGITKWTMRESPRTRTVPSAPPAKSSTTTSVTSRPKTWPEVAQMAFISPISWIRSPSQIRTILRIPTELAMGESYARRPMGIVPARAFKTVESIGPHSTSSMPTATSLSFRIVHLAAITGTRTIRRKI